MRYLAIRRIVGSILLRSMKVKEGTVKILCVGGGSGGHIAPIVAVVEQLRQSANIRKMGGEPEIRKIGRAHV